MAPHFLTLEDILREHQELIERYGGSHGLLNQGSLESAINTPRATFGGQFLHEDLHAMAAAYLFHLVENHAFQDGNKRIGAYAALAFLEINGIEVNCTSDELADLTLGVAKGEIQKAQVADFFRKFGRPSKG